MTAASETKAELREFEQNVQAIQEGLDAVDAGRVRPLEEFFAEHQQRFPDSVGSENHVLKDTAIERGH